MTSIRRSPIAILALAGTLAIGGVGLNGAIAADVDPGFIKSGGFGQETSFAAPGAVPGSERAFSDAVFAAAQQAASPGPAGSFARFEYAGALNAARIAAAAQGASDVSFAGDETSSVAERIRGALAASAAFSAPAAPGGLAPGGLAPSIQPPNPNHPGDRPSIRVGAIDLEAAAARLRQQEDAAFAAPTGSMADRLREAAVSPGSGADGGEFAGTGSPVAAAIDAIAAGVSGGDTSFAARESGGPAAAAAIRDALGAGQ